MKSERIEIRLPKELKEKLEEYSQSNYTSLSETIRQALVFYLNDKNKLKEK